MSTSTLSEQMAQIEQAIASLEGQRATLGDDVVAATVAALRQQLADLAPPEPVQQRKLVTVLFAEIAEFAQLMSQMDVEDANQVLQAVWEQVDAVILAHHGRIDKHIGAAVMALWGSEVAREDDPVQAVRAALALQKMVATIDLNPTISLTIGINTGFAMLGKIGADYTAMGDTVNTASRVQHVAVPGTILIAQDTYRHVAQWFTLRAQTPLSVKGKSDVLQLYQVMSAKPRDFQPLTPMIGRAAELAQLQEGVRAALLSNRLTTMVLLGEMGLGKSRLVYEFEQWFARQAELEPAFASVMVWRSYADEQSRQRPFALLRELFTHAFQIQKNDSQITARSKLEAGFTEWLGEKGREKAHFVGHLMGLDFSTSPYLQNILDDARQIYNRAIHYTTQLFTTIAQTRPVLFLLEDIHWADAESLDWLDYLVQHCQKSALCLLCSTRQGLLKRRPDYFAPYFNGSKITLTPLSDTASRQLIAYFLPEMEQIPQAVQVTILNYADGNPFYIEELVKMLVEEGTIRQDRHQGLVESTQLLKLQVPATLTGVLQARLDRLSLAEETVLQRAAVIGQTFWVDLLTQMEAEGDPILDYGAILTELQAKGLIFPTGRSLFTHTEEFAFKHVLLYEVVYARVLQNRRRSYHQQAAEWLIDSLGDRAMTFAGSIGNHYQQAERLEEAATWYVAAAKQANATYALSEANRYYQEALACQPDMPTQITIYRGVARILQMQARYEELLGIFQRLLATAVATQDRLAESNAYEGMAWAQNNQGDNHAALENAQKAEAIIRAMPEIPAGELASTLQQKGWVLLYLGQASNALQIAEECVAIRKTLNDPAAIGKGLNLMGACYDALGQFQQSQSCKERALTLHRQAGDRLGEAMLLNNLGETARLQADYQRAIPFYKQAIDLAKEIGYRTGELLFRCALGGAEVGDKQWTTAVVRLQSVIESAPPNWFALAYAHYFLADAYLGLGQPETAQNQLQIARALAQSSNDPEALAHIWRIWGRVMRQIPAPTATFSTDIPINPADCFQRSLDITTDHDLKTERGWALYDWAHYELAQGNHDKGNALWAEARAIFAELNIDPHPI